MSFGSKSHATNAGLTVLQAEEFMVGFGENVRVFTYETSPYKTIMMLYILLQQLSFGTSPYSHQADTPLGRIEGTPVHKGIQLPIKQGQCYFVASEPSLTFS